MKGQRDRPDNYGVLAGGLDQPARDQGLVRATSPVGDAQHPGTALRTQKRLDRKPTPSILARVVSLDPPEG